MSRKKKSSGSVDYIARGLAAGFAVPVGVVSEVNGTGTVNGITLTGTVTSSGDLVLGGTLSNVSLATQVSGTLSLTSQVAGVLPVANGGTGQSSYTNGQLLIGNTSGNTLTKATLTAGSGISITNGAGSITIAATGGGGGSGTVTSINASGGTTGLSFTGGPVTTSGTLTLSGTLAVANGGTGVTSLTSFINSLLPSQTSQNNKALYTDGTNPLWQFPRTVIVAAASDETTAITVGTNKLAFRMPHAMTLEEVRISLTTAQPSGSIFTVDINQNGTSILGTKLTIDNTEKTSTTAAASATIVTNSLTDDSEISVDVDQVGDAGAAGLKIYLIGRFA